MYNDSSNSHTPSPSGGNRPRVHAPAKGPKEKRNLILPLSLVAVGCAVFAFAAWSAVTSPALAAILNGNDRQPQFEQKAPGESFAQVYLAKPTPTPAAGQPVAQEPQPAATMPPTPAEAVVAPPTDIPATAGADGVVVPLDDVPATEAAGAESLPTSTGEAVVAAETGQAMAEAVIVADTPTSEYVAPTAVAYVPPASSGGSGGVHWFDVDLSDQRMYAYEGDTLMRTFVISTGTWQTPTVTGKFKVWIKLRSAPMSGPGYYLPDVPYIMYFHGDYGIHGTYWHNNFGVPMSHGCVNLSIPDAEWAYNFAVVGTVVNVHD